MDEVKFNPAVLDGRGTRGLAVPKSNWANKLDAPPFEAYAITCGITFTFGGLRINGDSQVLDTDEQPIPRSEEHTSELQSLMRNSYAVFCLKTNKKRPHHTKK